MYLLKCLSKIISNPNKTLLIKWITRTTTIIICNILTQWILKTPWIHLWCSLIKINNVIKICLWDNKDFSLDKCILNNSINNKDTIIILTININNSNKWWIMETIIIKIKIKFHCSSLINNNNSINFNFNNNNNNSNKTSKWIINVNKWCTILC